MIRSLLALSVCFTVSTSAQNDSQSKGPRPDRAVIEARMLERFPRADTNKDGKLSVEEFRSFNASRRNQPKPDNAPAPDFANVAYGDHEKQRFDLWLPKTDGPAPLAVFIHGGGFRSGDKGMIRRGIVESFIEDGVAFCSLNYRLSDSGTYPIMMHDAARAIQTLRHRAGEWNLDAQKIACFGGSAGAGISLWLAFHDDLARPESDDPVAQQSTRIIAAATMNGQSTYDMRTFRDWFGVPDLAPDRALPLFYGIEQESDWQSPRVLEAMTDASPITHLSEDDNTPVYMTYSRPNTKVTIDTQSAEWVHHVLLGLKLQQAMREMGNENCIVRGPDVAPENDPYQTVENFIKQKLTE